MKCSFLSTQIGILLLVMSLPLLVADAVLSRAPYKCTFGIAGPFEIYGGKRGSSALVARISQPIKGMITSGGSSAVSPNRSTLMARINDQIIGPAQAQHEQIEQIGGGFYSHWGDHLIFSLPPGVQNASDVTVTGEFSPRVHEKVLDAARAVGVIGVLVLIVGAVYRRLGRKERAPPFETTLRVASE